MEAQLKLTWVETDLANARMQVPVSSEEPWKRTVGKLA